MTETGIAIDGLRVAAGGRTILAVDRVRIAPDEVVGVIGPNGAGKSTLLKVCLGLVRIAAGRVRVLGQDVGSLGEGARNGLRGRIGYVPQGLTGRSEMPMTVREVVAIGRTGRKGLFWPLTGEDWRVVDTWIDRLGLSALSGRSYGELSGGEQRRALLARAMAQEPQVLLLDEPASHLDVGGRECMVEALERLHRRMAISIVMVCHELETFPTCCERMIVLENGRVTGDDEPEQVLTEGRICRLYGRGLEVMHVNGRYVLAPRRREVANA